MRSFALKSLLAAALCSLASVSVAQTWPTKPVRIIAPFPPGGTTDQISRLLGAEMAKNTGQQFIVENRAGASGSIGTAAAAKSAPDGYTFVMVFDTHAVNPALIENMPFDTQKDLAPVMLIGTAPMVVTAHPTNPHKSFNDMMTEAKAKPGTVAFGSIGSGSLGHLAFAQLGNRAGTEFNHIPYKGGGPLVTDAVGGQVPLSIATTVLFKPHMDTKRLIPLAVTGQARVASLPGIPTIAELGFPGFAAFSWWAVLAPAGTPPALIARMHEEMTKAIRAPQVQEKLAAQGMEIVASSPEQLATFVKVEMDKWAKVVKDNKIKPD